MVKKLDKLILEVKNLKVCFNTDLGPVYPVDNVSFSLKTGETLGIVGESGCGKSLTALACINLLPHPGRVLAGEVIYKNENILNYPPKKIRKIRGNEIAMVFQEPMTALNPVFRIGTQLASVISINRSISKKQARVIAADFLSVMGIPQAKERMNDFPHQLSGGMRQRVLLALALACEPQILIADEPTTALDVTTQSVILDKIRSIQANSKLSTLIVSHDLGVVSEFCQSVLVMYCGRIVEKASVEKIFSSPRHPYTVGLLNSIPQVRKQPLSRLPTIEGAVPNLHELNSGCKFANRCARSQSRCLEEEPPLLGADDHAVACFFPVE